MCRPSPQPASPPCLRFRRGSTAPITHFLLPSSSSFPCIPCASGGGEWGGHGASGSRQDKSVCRITVCAALGGNGVWCDRTPVPSPLLAAAHHGACATAGFGPHRCCACAGLPQTPFFHAMDWLVFLSITYVCLCALQAVVEHRAAKSHPVTNGTDAVLPRCGPDPAIFGTPRTKNRSQIFARIVF